jgi:hypothetical protein
MKTMPYASKWQQMLTGFYDAPTSERLIAQAQADYAQFAKQHASDEYQRQQALLNGRILPGLSIYKALRDNNASQEKALAEVETLFRGVFMRRMLQGIRLLNYLPDPFPIVKPALKRMTIEEYLPGSQEIIADSPDCFAVNIYRCYIFDILTRHNAPELTRLYCNTDDWLSEAMPKVRWERTKTLGRGDECCDFRWCRSKK